MSMFIHAGDMVRKNRVERILSNLLGELGCGHEDIESFLCLAFGLKKEITFQEFIIHLFQHLEMGLSRRDQEAFLNILNDNSSPNEALKRAAETYEQRYDDYGWPH